MLVSSCTVDDEAFEICTCYYLVVQYTTKHLKYMLVFSCTSEIVTSNQLHCTWWSIRHMCQYLFVLCKMKHQKYVPVSSCTKHNKASEICATTFLYCTRSGIRNMCQYLVVRTRWSIRNMCQHLVALNTMKHQNHVPVFSCRVYDEASEICVSA